MPKQSFEIKGFSKGIVSNPEDERDVPSDAATYSLDIDPQANGVLKGMPDDAILKSAGFYSNILMMNYIQGGATAGTGGDSGPAPGGD